MGAGDSKKQQQSQECSAIEDDDNFDLPGCLESLSDMAHTGKNTPLPKSSATSRALWGMSRALSAPVTASNKDPRRPSLTRSKALSLDTYPDSSLCNPSTPLGVLREQELLESNNDYLSTRDMSQRASPSIEVIPPDIVEQPAKFDTLDYSVQKQKSSRLHVPTSSNKHSLLLEKRKKLLKKASRVEEDTPEAFSSNKRHSPSPENVNDWEHIQEWMVWCIHENLDDTSEEEIFGTPTQGRSPMHRGSYHQGSPGIQESLYRAQHQLTDMHLSYQSSPSFSYGARAPLHHQQRSLPLDDRFYSTESSSSNMSSLQGRRSSGSYRTAAHQQRTYHRDEQQHIHSRAGSKSPVNRKIFNQEGGSHDKSKPKHRNVLSLDSHLLNLNGQSSFESSGSSRMNSFDSTGTHNDKI